MWPRAHEARAPWWAWGAAGILLMAFTARYVASGILADVGMPANVLGLEPLFGHLVDGRPIAELGPRTYGPVAFLLFDPAVRMFGRDAAALNAWGLALSLLALVIAFGLTASRLRIHRPLALVALAVLWLGYLPIVYATALRHFDMIVLALLAGTYWAYAGAPSLRPWSGVTAAAGFLTKFLPLIFLPVMALRERRAFAYGVGAVLVLLAAGQFLYGTSLGLGYFFAVGGSTAGSIDDFSTWHEGFSLRQLLFKFAGGFHLRPDSHVDVAASVAPIVSVLSYALQLALFGYLLFVVFRYRQADGLRRRSAEFALAIVTMYVVAPTVGHEHLVSMAIVYSVVAWYWASAPGGIRWRPAALAALSLLLTGVYMPMQVVGAVLPLDTVMRLLGNEHVPIYGNAVGQYDFLGFPGYGILVGWIVVAMLERETRSAVVRERHSSVSLARG